MADKQKIISASRRTDIPGGYTPWFLDRIQKGSFTITNPFNRKTTRLDARPENIHTIVFWSKNYGPFLDLDAHKRLNEKGYHLFFNFTINTSAGYLEPGLPALNARIGQAARIARDLDPGHITWRFDPICFYKKNGVHHTNLEGVEYIADRLSDMGITRCVTSFYDHYKKIDRRLDRLARAGKPKIEFTDPDHTEKKRIIEKMAGYLSSKGIRLSLCCEKAFMEKAGLHQDITANACIDGKLYRDLFTGRPETAADYGQRRKKGCQCTRSVDVGSYDLHPCPHNCLFCYARTEFDTRQGKGHA